MLRVLSSFLLVIVQWDAVLGDCGVVTRQQWDGLVPHRVEYLPRPVGLVIIMHTVSPACGTDKDCEEQVRNLQTYFLDDLNYWDLGPSFLVGGNGKVYEGPGWLHVGAHTYGYNRKSIGISFIGNFNKDKPTPQALAAAKALIKCGVTSGHLTSSYKVVGHRQLIATESPGRKLYHELRLWPDWTDNLDGIKTIQNCGVVTRQQWDGLAPHRVEYLPRPVGLVIIMHTVSPACTTDKDCEEQVRNLQTYFLDDLNYWDLGPSFLVGGNGKVYEGPGWLHVGAHTYGYNRKSIGISFIGNFNKDTPTPQALAAAKALIECGVSSGHLTSSYKVVGHRQLIATESPGRKLYHELRLWPDWTDNLDGIKNN